MKYIFRYLLIIGIIFSFIIPPFQKPDETVHFKKTLAVAYGIFSCPVDNQLIIPQQFKDLIGEKDLQSIIAKKNKKLTFPTWKNEVVTTKANYQSAKIDFKSTCQLPSISYLPQSVGLIISRFFKFNQYFSFFLGRLIAFLLFFVWLTFLIKSSPTAFQKIILLTFSLPMTIHQLTAYSYDGLQIMSSLTVFTGLLKILDNKTKNKKIWLLVISLCIIAILTGRPRIKVSDPLGLQPDKQLNLLISNPLFFTKLIINSTFTHFIFYAQGLIGIFGWLEYGLPIFIYFVFVALILYAVISIKLSKKYIVNNFYLLILTIGIFSGYLFILTTNYLRWTPYNTAIIEGVQGRYFILLFPYFIYWLISLRNKYLPRLFFKLKIPSWLIVLFMVVVLLLIYQSLLIRFYL